MDRENAMKKVLKWSLFALGASLFLTGCGGQGTSLAPTGGGGVLRNEQTLVGAWNSVLEEAIRTSTLGPTVTSRAIGIVNTAMYDAWAAYDPVAVGTRLGGSLRQSAPAMTQANKEQAISFAAYRALVDLYPADKARFDAMMASLGFDPSNTATDNSPAGIGNQAAAALLAYRHADGSNQNGVLGGGNYSDYTGYVPVNTATQVNDPSRWQPLTFSTGATPGFLTPHWGQVKTFAIPNVVALRAPAPPAFGSAEYNRQVDEIVELTANLTDEQKMIAEYWANGPKTELPPGHWILFAQWVARRDGHTLDEDVKMFFMVGNAVLDSGICCWDSKRFYDYARPITAIRIRYQGQNIQGWGGPGQDTVTLKGENWIPYQPGNFITPPFAEYTSGHSTFSAASAEVLKRFTGSDFFGGSVSFAVGSSTHDPGRSPKVPVTLNWSTFTEAADEAGMSRRYGGIHFESGDMEARRMGRHIGGAVYDRAMEFINGTGTPD